MDKDVLMTLVHNAALLLLIVYLYDLASARWRWRSIIAGSVPVGVALGLVALAIMLTPLEMAPGVYYDTRAVLLSVAGLFFGWVPTLIAMLIAVAYRFYSGGIGVMAGVSVILAGGSLGLVWRYLRRRETHQIKLIQLYIFGVVTSAVMLSLQQLLLPASTAEMILPVITLPVMLIYPVAVTILGTLILSRVRHDEQADALAINEAHLQALYQYAPVALWKEDWSGLWQALDKIKAAGVKDLELYFQDHPGELWRLASLVKIVDVNDAALALAGLQNADQLSPTLERFFTQDGIGHFARRLLSMAAGNDSYRDEYDFVRPDGKVLRLLISLFVIPTEDQQRNFVVVSTLDVTEQKNIQSKLRESYQLLADLTDQVPGVIFQYQMYPDGRSRFPYVSQGAEKVYGVRSEDMEIDADTAFSVIHPDDLPHLNTAIINSAKSLSPFQYEYRITLPDGGERWMNGAARPTLQHDQSVVWHGYAQDVTERKQAESRLLLAERVFDAAGEAIMVTDDRVNVIAINPAFTKMTGYTEADVMGKNPRLLASGAHGKAFYKSMWDTLKNHGSWSGELWNRRHDGEIYPEWLNISVVKNPQGEAQYYVAVFSDLSEIRRAQEVAENLSWRDALTGLANRPFFIRKVDELLESMQSDMRHADVLLIDIDRFKEINEVHGLVVGDLLLQKVALRLTQVLPAEHVLSRIGGDEFAVLLPCRSAQGDEAGRLGLDVAEKIRTALHEELILKDQTIYLDTSIGIVVFPESELDTAADVLQQAELAVNQAKQLGGGRSVFFQTTMGQEIRARYQLEQALRFAVNDEQLRVYLQPQVNAAGEQVSAEALIRWQHPERGLIPPGVFIPVAESSDLICAIEHWMLRAIFRLLVDLDQQGQGLRIAVNISARHFEREDFVAEVKRQIAQTGVDPSYLVLEITESIVIDNFADVIAKMLELTALGIHFSMDDFGTGYSSLGYLKRLPIHELKIDRSFIQDAPTDPNDGALVETILGVAKTLHLQVVAEGVETQAQADFLNARGEVIHQGYLYGRPVPLAQWREAWLHNTFAKVA